MSDSGMKTGIKSTNLYRMPMNFDDWQKMTAGLTESQEGTLLRATRHAWNAPHRSAPPATLPNDDAELARMFGSRNNLECVRRFFTVVPDAPQLLSWRWLVDRYADAMAAYQARKLAGVESGETRRRKSAERKAAKAAETARSREQCSNNVQLMLEQPKPNPVGDLVSPNPPTGAAASASALESHAPPPDKRELAFAWIKQRPETFEQLEREADAHMAAENPRWREFPGAVTRRDRWLTWEVERVYGAHAGAGDVAQVLMAKVTS